MSGLRMKQKPSLGRRAANHTATAVAVLSTLAALAPLLAVLGYVLWKGIAALTWSFFAHGPQSLRGADGGLANGILGSLVLLGVASVLGLPLGIGAGVFLAEYTRVPALRRAVRFTADVLNGVPSIVVGIVVYAWVVTRQQHFSAFAGGVALAMIMVPSVARTTEEMLGTVPQSLREAAWGLGVARWRTIVSISLRTALPGIVTGCMLAFARVAGEAAPLLFTAFGNQFVSMRLSEPIAALPLQIFVYGLSPAEEWHRQAWGAALLLITLVVVAMALVRVFARRSLLAEER